MPITPIRRLAPNLGLIKNFAALVAALFALLLVVGGTHYYTYISTERAGREASESLNVDLARRMVATDIDAVVSDLHFLAEDIQRQDLTAVPSPRKREQIALEFLVFAKSKGLYDQIRYLDIQGMETIRVNHNGGQPASVPGPELQNKASRYYFREALQLAPGQIYISPLDLNVEEGHIEEPLKPVMRFATPVFDRQGRKQGIVVLNYFGDRLIDNFVRAAGHIADHVSLVNDQGYWLRSPREGDEWGFMLGNDKRFQKRFPDAWVQILEADRGQFHTKRGLFTFSTVFPEQMAFTRPGSGQTEDGSARPARQFWKIVSQASTPKLSEELPAFIHRHWSLYAAILALLGLGSWLLALAQYRHRQAETQSEYERRFRHALENIDLAAVALDRQGRATFCNNHFVKITGWRHKDVVGKRWTQHFVPPDQVDALEELLKCMDKPADFPKRYEGLVRTRNGDLRLLAWNNTLSYDAEGRVIGVTGIGEDITDQRRIEEELHKLYRAVEQSPSIVLITNRNGLIEYVNPKFTQVSGYSLEEVLGHNPKILKSGEKTREEYADLWRTIQSGGEWRGEFHNRKKNGELYWESASISAIRDQEGEITHFLAVKEDITERKRLETEVQQRNRELAQAQALAVMGRMASMIAHDLRNPLSSVKMTLQILDKQTENESSDEAGELRQIALEQIRYMEDILSDMLTYSRPDALNPEWITIDKVLESAAGLAQRQLDQHRVKLNVHYQSGLPTFHGDANKLRQVFSNLITNAAQSTENIPDPRVNIEAMVHLGPGGTGIRVEICDNGCGFDPAEGDKLFEPFYTTRAKGTGLGLAIVKRVLDQHQASIGLCTNEPHGSCIVVLLPTTPQTQVESGTWNREKLPS